MRALNAFYETPVGRKTIAVMPGLIQESMSAGAEWGKAIAPRIEQRIRARLSKENIRI